MELMNLSTTRVCAGLLPWLDVRAGQSQLDHSPTDAAPDSPSWRSCGFPISLSLWESRPLRAGLGLLSSTLPGRYLVRPSRWEGDYQNSLFSKDSKTTRPPRRKVKLLEARWKSIGKKRAGVEVLELILVLPILFLTLIAAVQFSSVMAVDTTLSHASMEASRLAAMGCGADEITDRVNEFLSVHATSLNSGARIVIEDSTGIVQSTGDASLVSGTIGTPVDAGCIRATLLVATDAQPIPNLLDDHCVDFSGKQSEHVSVAMLPTCRCP